MIKKIQEPGIQQIERLVNRLSLGDKIRLFRKLGRETAVQRMKEIFKEIDEQRRQFSVSDKEIQKELTLVRRKVYGSRRR